MHIDDYRHGHMVIDGQAMTKDLIITPSGVHPNWWRDEGHVLSRADLEVVFRSPPRVLIVGTGSSGLMRPKPEVSEAAGDAGFDLEVLPTAQAAKRFNELIELGEADVAAAFHLTC